jgi:hypothetical protein
MVVSRYGETYRKLRPDGTAHGWTGELPLSPDD